MHFRIDKILKEKGKRNIGSIFNLDLVTRILKG